MYITCTLRCKPEGRVLIPDSVIETFECNNHSGRNMAPGSTQPVTDI